MPKTCRPDQIINPITKRCIKKNGRTAKKVFSRLSPKRSPPKSPKRSPPKSPKRSPLKLPVRSIKYKNINLTSEAKQILDSLPNKFMINIMKKVKTNKKLNLYGVTLNLIDAEEMDKGFNFGKNSKNFKNVRISNNYLKSVKSFLDENYGENYVFTNNSIIYVSDSLKRTVNKILEYARIKALNEGSLKITDKHIKGSISEQRLKVFF